MIDALLALLASAGIVSPPERIGHITRQECPAPVFDEERGYIGDRAIIADDGSSLVVQCGDGDVRLWQADSPAFRWVGRMPLFRAAQEQQIIPADLHCPWPSLVRNDMKIEADCDVLHRSFNGEAYILRTPSDIETFVVSGANILWESSVPQTFGALPQGERPSEIYIVRPTNPEILAKLSLSSGQVFAIAKLPRPLLLLEEGEGSAFSLSYSYAYRALIASFGGSFAIAREMTYLRAFREDGRELWNIRAKLPPPEGKSSITGDHSHTFVFAEGRYALFAKGSDRTTSQVIDLKDGAAIATIRGWPLAAARDSAIALLKEENGALSVVQFRFADHNVK